MSNKASQRQIIGSVDGIEGYFAQVSGGEISANSEKVFDGGSLKPDTLCGVRDIGNVSLSRPYQPVRDGAILRQLRPLVGRWRADVIVQDTDCDLVPIGEPRVYQDAVLVGIQEPDGDANSSGPAGFSLTFSVSDVS